jgi:hypothetical protein
MNRKGLVKLKIENMLESLNQECYAVDSLTKSLDVILGRGMIHNPNESACYDTPFIKQLIK